MDRKARFNVLRSDLRYPLPDLAHHLKLSFAMVKAYASESRADVVPSTEVLFEMEALLIDQAIMRCRAAGLEVIPGRKKAA